MKNKVFLAMMAMCVALTASACGTEKKETDTKTEGAASAEESGEDASGEEDTSGTEDTSGAEDTSETEDTSGEENEEGGGEAETEEEITGLEDSRFVSVENVEDYVKIGEYKGLSLERVVQQVSDEDVEAQIAYDLQESMTEITDTNDVVKEGDRVEIDYTGTVDGKEFEESSETAYEMVIGEEGTLIDGFDAGVTGMKIGETKTLKLTLPDIFADETLAGKEAEYQVTLNKLYRAPELTDEWVSENMEAANIDEYRANVKAQLELDAEDYADYVVGDEAWNTVLENSEVLEYPEEDLKKAVEQIEQMNKEYAEQFGIELEEFAQMQGLTLEELEAENEEYAKDRVKQGLIVQGIMDAEGIKLTDPECEAILEEMLEDYDAGSYEELVKIYGEDAVKESIGLVRIENLIVDNATVTEKVGNGDVEGEDADVEDEIIDEDGEAEAEIIGEEDEEMEGELLVADEEMEAGSDEEETDEE